MHISARCYGYKDVDLVIMCIYIYIIVFLRLSSVKWILELFLCVFFCHCLSPLQKYCKVKHDLFLLLKLIFFSSLSWNPCFYILNTSKYVVDKICRGWLDFIYLVLETHFLKNLVKSKDYLFWIITLTFSSVSLYISPYGRPQFLYDHHWRGYL